MEISMTDKNVIELVHETLMVGTVRPKKVPKGKKKQWRWGKHILAIHTGGLQGVPGMNRQLQKKKLPVLSYQKFLP